MSSTAVKREPIHERKTQINTYLREDGLWDLVAVMSDIKAYDFTKRDGTLLRSGDAVHDLLITVTCTDEGLIVEAAAKYNAAPYNQICIGIESAYNSLVGMHLLRNFRQQVRERFAKTAGCTHLSELVVLLPTVFVQSLAKRRNQRDEHLGKRPFQLEGCYALRLGSSVVQKFYPEWYRPDPKVDTQ